MRRAMRARDRVGEANPRRLVIFLPAGAVNARVSAFTATGVLARLDGHLPPHTRFPFTLHLPRRVVSGELVRVGEGDGEARLQFTALTPADRAALAPFQEADS